MTRRLSIVAGSLAILAGCVVAAATPLGTAQAQTVRPAIIPDPPAPPSAPVAPVAPEAPPALAALTLAAPPPPPAPPAPPQAPTAQSLKPPAAPNPPATAPAPPAPPAAPEVPDAIYDANIRVDVTISYQVGNAPVVRRSATLVAANESRSTSLRAGVNVAVPSTTYTPVSVAAAKSGDDKASSNAPLAPLTSYNYRSVGLNLDLNEAKIRRTGRVQIYGLQVEFSAVDEKMQAGSQMPSFPTFSQRFNLTMESGKPLVVAQSLDVVDGVERKQTVEVKATILPGGDDAARPRR